MSATQPSSPSPPFAIGTGLSIREVHDLRERLIQAVDAGPVVLDASAVERADSAGLQLIVSLGRSLAARGETLSYSGVSAVVTEVAAMLGLLGACGLAGRNEAGHGA